jgi:hypothetical protein
MTIERITPESFDELTVQEARDFLDRGVNQRNRFPRIAFGTHLTERPATFVFRNREGTVGVPVTHILRSHTHGWRTFMDALPLRSRNGNRGDLPTIPNSWDETWNCAAGEPDTRSDCFSRTLTISQSMYH